jgi:hypothetical protein
MWCALVFFLNNKHQGYEVVKGSREYERIKQNYIDNVLKVYWTPERRDKEKNKWTPEMKEKWKMQSIICQYGNYEEYIKQQEEKETKKLGIIRSKVINKIINQCRKKLEPKAKKYYYIKKLPEEKKLQCKKIICLETLEVFNSIKDAAKWLNVKHSNLWRILQNNSRYSTIHNYHFEYYVEGREYKK